MTGRSSEPPHAPPAHAPGPRLAPPPQSPAFPPRPAAPLAHAGPAIPDVAPHHRAASPRPAPAPASGPPAGFWVRVAAYLIDSMILGIALAIIIVPIALATGKSLADPAAMGGLVILIQAVAAAVSLGYILYFWSTSGATPGKRVMSLKIVREDGVEPMGVGKAFVRFLGYMVSGMTCYIGFIMVAFTKDKKGLHDMIAKTRVIRE